MKKSTFLLVIILLVNSTGLLGQSAVKNDIRSKKLIKGLNSSQWSTVYKSKDSLEVLEKEALPYLIKNLNTENKYVKLKNTADLIYPGATEFYGHGWVVDYDIDWLNIRTGWVIEEITFENFGFKESKITEDDLFKIMKDSLKYQKYLKTGKYDFNISPDKIAKLKTLIKKVNNWWDKNSSSWTRLKGITDALKSNDVNRQSDALQYLRHGQFCINGLTRKYFEKELRPIIEGLLNSKEEFIREDVKLLLSTVDYKGDFVFKNITTKCWNE